MLDKVIFYCHFGAGDIFESREFVKEWTKLVPANEYYYAHGKNPKILRDIPELKFTPVTDEMRADADVWIDNNTLFVNTWIGRDGQYVLPGIGTTLEEFYRMNNDMLRKMKFGKLSNKPVDYIPDFNFEYFPDTKNVDEFVSMHLEDKIIIDNGWVGSAQAPNFDWHDIIYRLAGKYPEKCFIVTHALPMEVENVYPVDTIIKSRDGFDLPEVSYLSNRCSMLIGRNSGPHVHMQTKTNCMDENKKLLSFTYQVTGSSFVENTIIKMKKYWSPYEDDDSVFERIIEVINE